MMRWLGTTGALEPELSRLLVTSSSRAQTAAWAVFLLELLLPVLLLVSRTRLLGVGLALSFHLLLEWFARPDLLGIGMMVLLVAFLPRDEPRRGTLA